MAKKKKKKKIDELEQLQDEMEVDTLFNTLTTDEIKEEKKDDEKVESNIFQREIDHPKAMIEQKEKEEKKEKVKQELERVRKETKRTTYKSNFLSAFLLFITMVLETCYLAYNIIYMVDEKNQLFLIINSILLLVVTSSFGLGMFVKKDRSRRTMNVITSLLLVAAISFNILVTTNVINLPTKSVVLDFRNQQVIKAMKWANNHNINLTTKYEYSDEFKENTIMKQSVKPDTLTSKVKAMEVVVSNGPNYDLEVNIPDMIGWNIDEVVKIIKKNKLDHVTIDYEFKDDIKRDEEFEQNKSGNMKRSDELKLKFSLGKEEDLEPVKLKDLTEMEEFDATLWLKRNGIKYDIIYEYHDDIEKDHVIKTDPKAGTVIKQDEMKVKLYISKGKKIKAPDFTKMSLEEIEKWANQNHMKINYSSEYSSSVKAGKVIRASVQKGDSIDEGTTIHIVTSKGPLKMIQYGDNDVDKIRTFASEHGLQFVLNEEFSDSIKKGKIISVDKKPGQTLSQTETITVVVSLGKKRSIPNFIGMTRSDAKKTCDNNGLSCTFNYAYSTKTKDTVINQNKTAGSEVSDGTSVILTISNGKRPTASTGGGNSSSNNNGGNTSNTPTSPSPNPEPVCTPYTFLYGGTGSTGTQTYAMIKATSNNKYLNIVPNYVTACPNGNSTNGAICSSSIANGATATTCDTITVTIVNK